MSFGSVPSVLVIFFVHICLTNGATLDKPCLLVYDPKVLKTSGLTYAGTGPNSSAKQRLEVPNGQIFRLECSERLDLSRRSQILSWDLKCRRGFLVTQGRNVVVRQDEIDCIGDTKPRSEVIRNGTCHNNATKLNVYFSRNVVKPYVLYSVCHDEKQSITLYSESYIDGKAISDGHLEGGSPRPPFQDTDVFPFDVNQYYKRVSQSKHLEHLLGSAQLIKKYIPSDQYFFSRGHLFPNGDPIHKYEKDATFYYINAVPQWQVLNAGNWEKLEFAVRSLAESLESKLKVWTGTFGVLQLNDINNNPVDLWMKHAEQEGDLEQFPVRRLPVPKFLWKVVFDEAEKAAVAVIQINNPWQKAFTKNELLCTDICDDIPWIRFDTTVVKKGYTYCCDVNDLKKSIDYIPSLNYTKLLDYEEKSVGTGDKGDVLNGEDEDEGYSSEESDESASNSNE